MVSYRVRASSLSEVGSLMSTVIATFDAHLSEVDARVQASVGSAWTGEDSESFAEGWATFQATAGFVRQSLVALQGGLFAADGSYTQTETGVQRTFTGRAPAVAAVRSATSGTAARVVTGEERADGIAEHFGRGDGAEGGRAAFLTGANSRASGGRQSRGPADDASTDAAADADGTVTAEATASPDAAASFDAQPGSFDSDAPSGEVSRG